MTPCRLAIFATYATIVWAGAALAAAPVFENRTPAAFSPQDSTTRTGFVAGQEITVRADLNQAATVEYPVIGHFHGLEKSDQLSATDTDGMQVDVATAAVVPFGTNSEPPVPGDSVAAQHPTLHMAWIEQNGFSQGRTYNGGITPVYRVMYACSFDGGATFSSPASVCGTVTYHLQTADGSGGSFSTLDLAVDSGGRPRIAYAFVSTADRKRSRNVYLAYSQDGGGTWQTPLTVNDAATVGADLTGRRSCAFPRLAIDDRDEIFVGYVRGTSRGTGTDDVILAKVNRQTSPFSVLPIGANGATGTGGVRLTPDGERHTGPDLAMGDGDVLHVVYFNDTDDRVEHRCLATDTTWVQVGATGWNQNADGAQVSSFVDEAAANASLETDAHYFFPTVVVDRRRTPDRVYALFKYGDNTPTEGIRWNQYDDGGTRGTGATWGTAAWLWSSSLFGDGAGNWGVELDWEITERVAAVVDQRLEDRGDLHVAFTAGYSGIGEHDLYYAYGNGTSWTLPEKVADDDSDGSGTGDGIDNGDTFLLSPALTAHPDIDNLFLAFTGGSAEGFGVNQVSSVAHHPYLKVLGRAITWEDQSVPVGGYQYDLTYTPINPHDGGVTVADNAVWVHAADASDGSGLGAIGASTDGFLAGDWETVATTLADDDKYYEGLIDENPATTNEWGDDDDKVGLLVKLNLLGSDSATNLQLVTNSTASAAGTGKGARTVRVGTDPRGSFTGVGRFFSLGADVDIVAANAAPTLSIAQPDGTGDTANTEFTVQYTALDGDDDLGGNLRLALYAYPTGGLRTVQDVRIFGTLIVDENDVPAVNPLGTGDLTEGNNQSYTWDDPPAALRDDALFASILRLRSGSYWIYLVADDGRNPPAFAVSSGPLTLRHGPLVRQVSPIAADTVDTGVRTGAQANPYDLDLTVVDYDSEARVQLFYAAASGIASVSARGTYPNQNFVLGKSVAGTRGTAILASTSLTTRDTEYSWDVTSPLIGQGSYYLYAVATDSVGTAVGQSPMPLVVRHSPSFVFYEPSRDTQRELDSGSQPVYTIQWQKGPGDGDLDHDATIAFYFTTDDPAATDHATDSGASATSLLSDPDTRLIVSGLTENADGAADLYAWDLRQPPAEVPENGVRVWLYAVIADGGGNSTVARGGALVIRHTPQILLKTAVPGISQGDLVRLEWDDYLVDDGSGTDDAHIRLYASATPDHAGLVGLEAGLGGTGAATTWLITSDDGTPSGQIAAIREDSSNAFHWRTRTPDWALPVGIYYLYAGISADPTFGNNAAGRISRSAEPMVVGTGSGTTPHLSLSPSQVRAVAGDTMTFELLVQSGGQAAEVVSVAIDLGSSAFTTVTPAEPFTDLGEVFPGGTVLENTSGSGQLRFTKRKTGGTVIGEPFGQERLASFRVAVGSGFSGRSSLSFNDQQTGLTLAGSAVALTRGTGLGVQQAQVQAVPRGRIQATVLLEGRAAPLGNGNHATLLDVHLRLPGSAVDVTDSRFRTANDDRTASADTVEVLTASDGGLTLYSVPAGRYVLAVKDSSHLSGRTDTLVVRPGETVVIGSGEGFFASDIRGDPSFLLEQDGRLLKAGDATGDNEIDEDDVNAIDAAWGTVTSVPGFARADVNNDQRVGVEDLTVASSNISNSTGFGAPPVYKATAGGNSGVVLKLERADGASVWTAGSEVELVLTATGLADLAGYGLTLTGDPAEVQLVEDGLQAAGLFAAAPHGYVRRVQHQADRVTVAAARRGRDWSASGIGELLRVRVRLMRDGLPASLKVADGRLVSSAYAVTSVALSPDSGLSTLPSEPFLGRNYPNPFNPATTVPFAVPRTEAGPLPVALEIFDTLGQRVRVLVDEPLAEGRYQAVWDGRDTAGRPVASGVYLCRLRAGTVAHVTRMLLLR